jgi:hypothetical protein
VAANPHPFALYLDDMNSPDLYGRPEWSDAEYVESAARNGCPDHFRVLVQRYQEPLFMYLSSRLGNAGEAEEAAQGNFCPCLPGSEEIAETRIVLLPLVPYGCTKFRMSRFPVTSRAWHQWKLKMGRTPLGGNGRLADGQ